MLNFLADTLALCLSGWLAYAVRTSEALFQVEPYLQNPGQYGLLIGTAVVIWHLLLIWRGGYERKLLLFRLDELLLQFKTSLLLFLLLMAATFLYHAYDFSRLVIFLWWLAFVFFGGIGRQIAHRLRERLHARGWGRRRVILTGSGPTLELFEKRLRENPGLGADIVASGAGIPLAELLSSEYIDEVFLFGDRIEYEQLWQLRETSRNSAVLLHLVPSFGNLYLRQFTGGFFDGAVMLSVSSPAARRLTLGVKRFLDVAISAAFLVLLAPLGVLFALLIRLDSAGPVLFAQRRIGRDGREFTIYKFRTMYEDAEVYSPTPTSRADPRITRIGALLRSTGLDELPQLWNVLIGDMSLVGPRPEMPFIVREYTAVEAKRLKVRPGITGLWQVYARTANLPIHSHVEYDLFYIENLSVSLDLMILLDTIPTLVFRTGI
ncbi:MAG TPA: sugar transferase [Candidatus Ozemobacteraceae bacterium]|nr:sugar transferase [Candidatus Ozemobacteraceae bacterium]